MKILSLLLYSALVVAFASCSRPKNESPVDQRARLELEEKSQREAEDANQAITHLNQKLGRKVAPLDLGLPSATQPATPQPPTPKP